MNKANPWAN